MELVVVNLIDNVEDLWLIILCIPIDRRKRRKLWLK